MDDSASPPAKAARNAKLKQGCGVRGINGPGSAPIMAFGKKFIGSQMVHSACNESLRDVAGRSGSGQDRARFNK
jgi:hypothetical protein